MKKRKLRNPIGLRTVKTAAAVLISMIVVNYFGTTSSKLFFAVLGALAAMQPTFSESLESCIIQILGVFSGAVVGGALVLLHVPAMLAASIGIVIVIILCNGFHISSSAGLACIIVVCMCLDGETKPITYAITRIWDTAIGLAIYVDELHLAMLRSWPEATASINIALIVRETSIILEVSTILGAHLDTLDGSARLIHNTRLEREVNMWHTILRSTEKALAACQTKQT